MAVTDQKMLEEFELIHWIQQQAGSGEHLTLGIGDDCSIQPQKFDRDLLTSVDLLIEDIHFKRQWTNMFDLGRKSAAVNISDIAAMGGTPLSLFLGISRPRTISDNEMKEFLSGFLTEAKTYGAVLTGGDSCASPGPLMISVTVQGEVPSGDAICRQGASYGDAIYVSGTLGDGALALSQLQQGQQPDPFLSERFHTPTPQVTLGLELAKRHLATAMLDVSDGLLADLGHILDASEVGAELNLAEIPLSRSFKQALASDANLIDLALAGGEDYELVFTSPLKDLEQLINSPQTLTRIGSISKEPGVRIRQKNGDIYHCQRGGFDHFSRQR